MSAHPAGLHDAPAIVLGVDAIGAGIAQRLARDGARVGAVYPSIHDDAQAEVNTESGQTAAAAANGGHHAAAAYGGQLAAPAAESAHCAAFSCSCDFTDRDATESVVNSLARSLGGLRVLVVNVLAAAASAPLDEQRDAGFVDGFARVRAAAGAMSAALPYLRASGAGRIVIIGHRYGHTVSEGIASYNAAAWSLIGLARTAAVDWGRYQVTTNLLVPLAATSELREYRARRPQLLDTLVRQLPLRRAGDPAEDIGAAAALLAGDSFRFVNGEIIYADGGQHVAGPVLNPGKFR